MRLSQYYQTIKHLKLIQIFYRIKRKIFKSDYKIYQNTIVRRKLRENFIDPIRKKPSLLKDREFIFLNKIGNINKIGWNAHGMDQLWRYNLHYFDDLNSSNAEDRYSWHKKLIKDWISFSSSNETVGVDSYPISLRVVNWIKWNLRCNENEKVIDNSLFNQGLHLEKNLEFHILGNHLFSNAKALIFLGCYFDGEVPDRWLKKGLEIIYAQLEEQILQDGANFELSPMYHSIFIEDILDILNILKTFREDEFKKLSNFAEDKVYKMIDWLYHMKFSNSLSLFNDTADGIAANFNKICHYASELGFKNSDKIYHEPFYLKHLKDSGYIAVYLDNMKIILDVANLGPNHLMAHSHADTLSFELESKKEKFFVNSGTSTYELSERRLFERSTKAHNCIHLNNKNSSDVWSSFRVGKRAKPKNLSIEKNENFFKVSCSHDGYSSIFNNLTPKRVWIFGKNKISIRDTLKGKYKTAVSRFILNSFVKISKEDDTNFILRSPNQKLKFKVIKGKANIVNWKHSHKMGELIENKCIEVSFVNDECHIEII